MSESESKKINNKYKTKVPTDTKTIVIEVVNKESSTRELIISVLNLVVLIIGFFISSLTIKEAIKQNQTAIDSLKEQKKINAEIINDFKLNHLNKPLAIDFMFTNEEAEVDLEVLYETKEDEIIKITAPTLDLYTQQGSIKSIKVVFADKYSFGIGEEIKAEKFPEKLRLAKYNIHKTGESTNYNFARQYFIIEGRDGSHHFYMLVYQIKKDSNTIGGKVLWGESELLYLNSEKIFIGNSFYNPEGEVAIKEVNTEYEEKVIFSKYLKQELEIFNKLVKNYKK